MFYLFKLWSLYAGEAESGLERLHQCAEKELQVYLNADGQSKDFNEFRTKLAGLTRLLLNKNFRTIFSLNDLTGSKGRFSLSVRWILSCCCCYYYYRSWILSTK